MTTIPIALTIIGLLFEFTSFYRAIRKNLFLTYDAYIKELGQTSQYEIDTRRFESRVALGLMAIGMALQGIALFLN